jgi:hypothetical protein
MVVLIVLALIYGCLQLTLVAVAFNWSGTLKRPLLWIALLIGAQAGWALWLNESPTVCGWMPVKYGIVVCNLIPGMIAATLAVLIASRSRNRLRTVVYVGLLLGVDAFFWGPAVYNPIRCGNSWAGACCLQTTDCTCMPAAAATLLKLRGVASSEDELKRLCLTTAHGTTLWGVYHGLREKADSAGKSVTVKRMPFDDFLREGRPALVLVMLSPKLDAQDARFSNRWGWRVNVAHAVVFLGALPGGKVCIADPRSGLETWDAEGLRALWRETAIYLD